MVDLHDRIVGLEERVAGLEERIARQDVGHDALLATFVTLDSRLEEKFSGLVERLIGLEERFGRLEDRLQGGGGDDAA